MNSQLPVIRTPRALYPDRREGWVEGFLYEPLAVPSDHPELPLFEGRGHGAGSSESAPDDEQVMRRADEPSPPSRLDEPMPSRMLNEFVYCPRLFYYEFVEGVFVESADTERGSALHAKVDRGKGELPAVKKAKSKKRKGA